MNAEEPDKPPSGDFYSVRQHLYDIGTLRLLCSGVGKDRFRTRLAWGIYCSGQSRKSDILETHRTNR